MTDQDFEQRLRGALRADAGLAPLQQPAPPVRAGKAGKQQARRPGRARRWAVPAVAALTAAGVALVVVSYGPASDRAAGAATAPMLSYQPAGAPPAGPLLSRLAALAARAPRLIPPAGGYRYQATESWNLVVAVGGGTVSSTVIPRLSQDWSTAGGRLVRETDRDAAPVAPGPLSRSEEAAARRETAFGPAVSGPVSSLPGGLPLAPRALFRRLADLSDSPPVPQLSSQVDAGRALLTLVNYLLDSPAPPGLLASVYRMVALFPGVSDAGWVTDRAGRRGLAIAVPTGGRGYEHSVRLIVDPRSGRLLDIEDIQVDPSAVKIRTPFVFSYVLFLDAGVTPSLRQP